MIVKLLVEAGDMKPGPAISQKLGPLGINIGKIIQEVNQATSSFKGLKLGVELDIDPKTKNFKIAVLSPPVSEMLKKELSIEKASGESKKIKAGNLPIEKVIKVALTKQQNLLTKDLKAAVKVVLGTCVSLGILVENKEAKEVMREIEQGVYDNEISKKIIEPSVEKTDKINSYFKEVKAKQDAMIKKEEEEKAAAEAQKAAVPATEKDATAKPAEEAKTPAAKTKK
jgi:large subunit ribosomal protein L11